MNFKQTLNTVFTSVSIAVTLTACNSGGSATSSQTQSLNKATSNVTLFNNVAILNNPTLEEVSETGHYKLTTTGAPFFTNVVLFAANINGNNPNSPTLFYNEEMSALLNTESGQEVIRELQQNGIKVQIAYLGNHQDAGWSCQMTTTTSDNLANDMVQEVVSHNLDGIMIDDEYSNCGGDASSFFNLVQAIKDNPEFNGKILSKALYEDSQYFTGTTNVAQYLDQGYQMSYSNNVNLLAPYVSYGMPQSTLGLGLSPEPDSYGDQEAATDTTNTVNAGYGGMMIWAPNFYFSDTQSASSYYSAIAGAEYQGASVSYIN